jgi:hypothetical protein
VLLGREMLDSVCASSAAPAVLLLFSGTRAFPSQEAAEKARHDIAHILSADKPSEVFVGDASGVDEVVVEESQKARISVTVFYACWRKYGKSAGPRRNRKMAIEAQKYASKKAYAFPSQHSRGTLNAIHEFRQRGIETEVVQLS